jgi:cholesterol transport system auxiliary component
MNLRALTPVIARLAALAAVAALGACITLFPKTAPSQLYRFDAQLQPPVASGPQATVRIGVLDFDPASSGDSILTVTGDELAYVQDGRWAIPASELFQEAVEHGFNAPGGQIRLVGISDASRAKLRLRLQVTHFETRYLNGPKAAPTVVVTMRATLNRQDGSLVGELPFDASVAAGDDTIGAIVQAYDAAVSKVVGDLVAWVDQNSAA